MTAPQLKGSIAQEGAQFFHRRLSASLPVWTDWATRFTRGPRTVSPTTSLNVSVCVVNVLRPVYQGTVTTTVTAQTKGGTSHAAGVSVGPRGRSPGLRIMASGGRNSVPRGSGAVTARRPSCSCSALACCHRLDAVPNVGVRCRMWSNTYQNSVNRCSASAGVTVMG